MTAPWHVTDSLATRYARGAAPEPDAWSLEKHVETCATCAARVSAAVRTTPAGQALAHVRSTLLETVRAEAVSPGALRPQTAVPVPVSPDALLPQAGQPEALRPQAVSPQAVSPDLLRPQAVPAQAVQPQAAPDALPPQAVSPQALRPQAGPVPAVSPVPVTPGVLRPQAVPPQTVQPQAVSPQALRPQAGPVPAVSPVPVSPEALRPQAVSPGPLRPQAGPVPVGSVRGGRRGTGRWRRPVAPSPGRRLARMVWVAGPAVRGAWLVAVFVVGVAAVGLAYGAGFQGARPVLLALAPVLPLGGVAVSYGRHADPMYEIGVATPSGGLRLLLTRAAAVLGVCVPLLTAAGALLPPVTGVPGAAAWLLPGLALTLATLVLGSFVGCRAAAATLTGGWLLAVAGPVLGRPGATGELARYLSGPAAQGGWAAAVVLCGCLLALRRRSFDHLETP